LRSGILRLRWREEGGVSEPGGRGGWGMKERDCERRFRAVRDFFRDVGSPMEKGVQY